MLVLEATVGIALCIGHAGGNNPLVTGLEENVRGQKYLVIVEQVCSVSHLEIWLLKTASFS